MFEFDRVWGGAFEGEAELILEGLHPVAAKACGSMQVLYLVRVSVLPSMVLVRFDAP